jgi:hypothetical protein
MNKRSALMVAAGLVLTLIVGGIAVAVGMTGPTVSSAVPRAERRSAQEPIVRTVRRTVTVHKKAEAKPGQVVQVAAPASTSSASTDESYADESYADESHEDDSYEDEDEAEDHEDEDEEDHDEDDGDDD